MTQSVRPGLGRRFSRGCFRVLRRLVLWIYPRATVEGLDDLPDGPCIVVGNHCQIHGPISGELYFPGPRAIWCAAPMMKLKEVPAYAFEDFWSRCPRRTHPFYRALSYLIAPLSVCIFNNAHTIPVWRDMRVMSTFRTTIDALLDGTRVIIFPECYDPHNHIVYRFQDRFVDVAKLYYRRTGQCLQFVPMYVAPKLHKMILGKPIRYDPEAPGDAERQRVIQYLMDSVTDIAERQPRHRVIPYAICPARKRPFNRPEE